MHDPAGRLEFGPTEVVRHCYVPLPPAHFLRTELATQLVRRGRLVDYTMIDDATLSSPRVPFVSYPDEWSDAQVLDAAKLTLTICETIVGEGWELKDASAWNVIFRGTRPAFCDRLSFQRIADKRWWAFAQFVRHFILPLCMSRMKVFDARTAFVLNKDGLQPEQARAILGARRFLTRYWPLMLAPKGRRHGNKSSSHGYHRNLYALIGWLLGGLAPSGSGRSRWVNYAADRDHYSPEASNAKREVIAGWLKQKAPEWVIDFGCNTGEYSLLAKAAGASVVAIDLDHDCVQQLYLSCPDEPRVFPLIGNLADMNGGRGWCGAQYPGLSDRLAGFADVSMMLAVIHHLAISHAVPYEEIAVLASKVTKRALILELIDENDPLVAHLCAQRQRRPDEFTLARQRAAFSKHFRGADEVSLPGTGRRLALLERV